ncbi:MAG: peptidase T [Candidatus Ozemobacteraceae bacterium]
MKKTEKNEIDIDRRRIRVSFYVQNYIRQRNRKTMQIPLKFQVKTRPLVIRRFWFWLLFLATCNSAFSAEEFDVQKKLLQRFLRYAAVNTQSKEDVDKIPSTPSQMELAKIIEQELRETGLSEVRRSDQGYVYATLPANNASDAGHVPAIGFICHLDISSAVAAREIHPILHENYQGGDIVLPGNASLSIKVTENHELTKAIGGSVVTSDGTSNLGADDKAGIAEVMTAMEYLIAHPEINHGAVKIAFTPDEEVDKGPLGFDVKGFGASFAYTIDGCEEGEINDETFNAASADVVFHGKSSHPGRAKGVMVNCLFAAADFLSSLPVDQRPEATEGRQGFLHAYEIKGTEETASIKMLLRDFEKEGLEARKNLVRTTVDRTRKVFPLVKIEARIEDTYKNMKTALASVPIVIATVEEAMKRAGIEPRKAPIRGGTDGADFSFMGLPCPNVFCGAQNEHTLTEWVASKTMEKAVQTIINIVKITAEKSR